MNPPKKERDPKADKLLNGVLLLMQERNPVTVPDDIARNVEVALRVAAAWMVAIKRLNPANSDDGLLDRAMYSLHMKLEDETRDPSVEIESLQ